MRTSPKLWFPVPFQVLSESIIGAGLSGQMGPVYMFSEPLQANVIHALYELGPNYLNAFDDMDAVDAPIGYHA